VRPGGRSQLLLQGFPQAETSRSPCSYICAKYHRVLAPANARVKSCVPPPVLPFWWLIILVQTTVRLGGPSQLLLQGFPGAVTLGSPCAYYRSKGIPSFSPSQCWSQKLYLATRAFCYLI
jgi:hypothetical protein